MMDGEVTVQTLLERLDAQRQEYIKTFLQIEDILTRQLDSRLQGKLDEPIPNRGQDKIANPSSPRLSTSPSISERVAFADLATPHRTAPAGVATFQSSSGSRRTGDDSDDDSDQNLYVQDYLESQRYEHEALRDHLQSYSWDAYGKKILENINDDRYRLRQPNLFPDRLGPVEDRSHYTAYQVFDVGQDGAPVPVNAVRDEHTKSQAMAIWETIRHINPPQKIQKAVGRITILREPSPILFGAIHFTTHNAFDTDELFRYLVDSASSAAYFNRAFDKDHQRRRSFVFSFEYFTLIGNDCVPKKWQLADRQKEPKQGHIAITRCSSVLALSLSGEPIRKLKNPSRRATVTHGYVYDPWAPWQVLSLQCCPDWHSTEDTHDSSKHYVNGVEAFMITLLSEYNDAERRLDKIFEKISHLVTPPLEFMFDETIRDKLLFEDREYTYSRRYFWAYQTLGLMINSIRAIVDAYEDTFTDEVWEGKHKTIWPLLDERSPRNVYFLKRMSSLRKKFDLQIAKLRRLLEEHEDRREEIRGLRDQLFSGTSVLESRKSVEMTELTVQQGHNIKVLTMVSIFFLPLTFVTSVFGMTNMPADAHFWKFAVVTGTVCVPFFVLIGSLNSSRGMHFWSSKYTTVSNWVRKFLTWLLSGIIRRRRPVDLTENAAPRPGQLLESGIRPKEDNLRYSTREL